MRPIDHALVLADGSVAGPSALETAWPSWSEAIDWVVAADGGARHARTFARRIDLWVGDGDSLGDDGVAALERDGVPVRRAAVDKDETDTELALLAAAGAGASRITIVGALGGPRLDHGLANIWLLAHPAIQGLDVRIVDAAVRIRLAGAGRTDLAGRAGDLVSLLPFGGDATGVRTTGLRYPLHDEPLPSGPSRGMSNIRVGEDASIVVGSGRLLVLETPARL
ncbi:MAG TPA: thiamine diphosphokinase [Candidatus Limnocylindrales bacterium]|nr:thiamine diphosphokinase [Candidatus Limnocylindrales bacterium]